MKFEDRVIQQTLRAQAEARARRQQDAKVQAMHTMARAGKVMRFGK